MDCRLMGPRRKGPRAIFLLLALLGCLEARAQTPPALRLLQRIPLPPASSVAMDVRWASDDSVYVLWHLHGVAEVGLDGARRRVLVPEPKTFEGMKHYQTLAVSPTSPGTLAVASALWNVVWRPLKANPKGKFLFHRQEVPDTQDLDVYGDRIVVLGTVRREKTWRASGEVAWVGDLRARLENLKPVLHDIAGAGAPSLMNCGSGYQLGAVRFLAGGSFVVAPGFQDGVHLFDAGGRRVRSWTNAQIGIDSHIGCADMAVEEELKLRSDEAYLERRVKSRHVLDDILPLPQGPGLLVRSWGADGRVHWTLKVLRPDGSIETFAVPVVGRRPFDRLQGDVRDGRIVLLLSVSGFPWRPAAEDLPAEVLLMALPALRGEGS